MKYELQIEQIIGNASPKELHNLIKLAETRLTELFEHANNLTDEEIENLSVNFSQTVLAVRRRLEITAMDALHICRLAQRNQEDQWKSGQ